MPNNSFGRNIRITTFGESHGEFIGGVIDGIPSGIYIDLEYIQKFMDLRKPGRNKYVSTRTEADNIRIISGVFEGRTTGAPLAILIPNIDQKSQDYDHIKDIFRPGHADYTYNIKYGNVDYRGGGRASARETAVRVAFGSIARMILEKVNIFIKAEIVQIGDIIATQSFTAERHEEFFSSDNIAIEKWKKLISTLKEEGDSVGGKITAIINGVEPGIGEPVFHKLHADLTYGLMTIPAAKSVEIGAGIASVSMKGSEYNDQMVMKDNKVQFLSNNSGGISGGISNGNDIIISVGFRPTSTIFKEQNTITKNQENIKYTNTGRHDPCVAIRATIVVESMIAITILDHYLYNYGKKFFMEK